MKRPKTYNVTFTVGSDGMAKVEDAFLFRKYNQHRVDPEPLSKRQTNDVLRQLIVVS